MSVVKEITAKQGKGDTAQEYSCEETWPEDFQEMVDMWGEEEVMRLAVQKKVVEIQANLRRPTERKTGNLYEIYKRLMAMDMSDENARTASGYSGNSDGSSDNGEE